MDLSVLTNTFGPWQRRIFIAVFYMNIAGVWQNFGIIFLASYPKYHCIEPFVGLNETCHVSNGSMVVPCTKWEYEGPNSIISEWDLVCDRAWLVSLSKSVYMIGFLFSVSIFGQLSDIFGRFPAMWAGYVIATASMFLTLLSSSYTMFLVLRFFQAFGRLGLQIISYVLLLEVSGVNNRTNVGVASQIAWTLSACILPGLGWLFQDWIWLQLVMSISFLPFAFAYGVIPESPRWLLMKGRYEQLNKTMRKVADINNVILEEGDSIAALKEAAKKEKELTKTPETIWSVYKSPQMRKRILILYYLWVIVMFMFYGLLFITNDVAGNRYLNLFISALLEFVSLAGYFWGIRKYGRRPTLAFFMLGGAIPGLVRVAVDKDSAWLQTLLWLAGKFFIKGSLGMLYLYSSELFPTVVRNAAVGSCSTMGRIGAILAPFVTELGKVTYDWVPFVIYGGLCLVGGLLTLLLPETKDRDIPDTIKQGEEMS